MPYSVTVVSLQTYGDFLLKSPFFHQLASSYPEAKITVVTNSRGAQIYPLIDSRLKVVALDKSQSRAALFMRMLRLPEADVVYVLDQHPGSYLLSLILRARQRIGWYQSVSRLYGGPEAGFRDRYAVDRRLSLLLRFAFSRKGMRSPESKYEGHVELELLDSPQILSRLAQYRTQYSFPPQQRADPPLIFCATFASWIARQIDEERWFSVITHIRTNFPRHRVLVDGTETLLSRFAGDPNVARFVRSADLRDFFSIVSSADAVVCSDSFVTHLASWFDVPAVSFFGPALPHRFAPTAPGSTVLFHEPSCSPCEQHRMSEPCAAGHRQCLSLQKITLEEIYRGLATAAATTRAYAPDWPGVGAA